jgi:hypothetical protein
MTSEEGSRDPTEPPLAADSSGCREVLSPSAERPGSRLFARSVQCSTGVESLLWLPG